MQISDHEFRRLLERYLRDTASPHERQLLDSFFDSYAHGAPPEEVLKDVKLQEKMLRRVYERVAPKRRRVMHRMRTGWVALAAVVSLFVLVSLWGTETKTSGITPMTSRVIEETTQPGERSLVHLPDGTVVHLNSDSKISYPEAFSGDLREVEVSGEAYLEVAKSSKPFIVRAGRIRTEVLGTAFDIRSRVGERIEVTLVEGKLRVVTTSGASTVLQPNQQAVIDADTLLTREVDVRVFTSWKDNVLFFEDTRLREAIAVLESRYGVEIDIASPALEQCLITGKYKDEPLGNVLSSFQFLLKLDIRRLNETHYTVTGPGCH